MKGDKGSAALELLPLLIPKRKKAANERLYFVDINEVSNQHSFDVLRNKIWNLNSQGARSLNEIINMKQGKAIRVHPYIICIGATWHIIVDSSPLVQAKESDEALLLLMAVHYVFNIEYCAEVMPTFLFLQGVVLGNDDPFSDSCRPVQIFKPLLEEQLKLLSVPPVNNSCLTV